MENARARQGLVMMVVGLAMVLTAVLVMVLTEDALPVPLGVIGIVFIAVGARNRREG